MAHPFVLCAICPILFSKLRPEYFKLSFWTNRQKRPRMLEESGFQTRLARKDLPVWFVR
jgi:hypothetical protein